MARSLDQILSSLGTVYNPQIEAVKKQQALIPQQVADEEQGLKARQTESFGEIVNSARRRGLGFSGIPLGEQAKYNATEFMPALARLKTGARQQVLSLEEALNSIYERRNTFANQLQQDEKNRAFQERQFRESQRQFNEQMALKRAAEARAAREAAANNGFNLTGNNGNANVETPQGGSVKIPAGLQQLYNQVFVKKDGSAWSDRDLVNDYNATLKSARYGNSRDKQKLELYHAVKPDIFGTRVPISALGNGSRLRY